MNHLVSQDSTELTLKELEIQRLYDGNATYLERTYKRDRRIVGATVNIYKTSGWHPWYTFCTGNAVNCCSGRAHLLGKSRIWKLDLN
jgi:hypothetical protein